MGLLNEGQIIRETYEVERFLGEGAFAEVYRVRHRFLGRQAMKVFKLVGMTIAETEQMLDEAVMLSRIGHPNIVRVFDANITTTERGDCGFFTMEYVPGGSLDQFWRSHGARLVPLATTVEIMRQVCQGLALAHAEQPPIVHRDIKPQNILVGYDGAGLRARVSDFGLAKRVNPLTLMASARGTLAFKAPEVFHDAQTDSCAGDVWAIGTTLYLLLTDRLPHADLGGSGSPDPETFQRPLIPPSRLNLQVDGALDQIIARTLAPKPSDRYPDARVLLADLDRWIKRGAAPDLYASSSSALGKAALGQRSSVDDSRIQQLIDQAQTLARQAGRLSEAADLLEQALNTVPLLREQYEYRLKLWRRGIAS